MRRRVSELYARWAVVVGVDVAAVQKFRGAEVAETGLVCLAGMFVVVGAAYQRANTHNPPPLSARQRHSFGSSVHEYIVSYIPGHH
jgi:hypothetical protein